MSVQVPSRPGKGQYSEAEAAEQLGISVAQLRTMIRSHVVDRDEDLNNVPVTTFQPSDLLILRLLTGMQTGSEYALTFAPQIARIIASSKSLRRLSHWHNRTTRFSRARHHGLSHGRPSSQGWSRCRAVVAHRQQGAAAGEVGQRHRLSRRRAKWRSAPTIFSTASAIPPWRSRSRSDPAA